MKKTFKVSHEKKTAPRLFEAFKHEVKKYIKRERKRALPEGFDFWDFDCRYGADEASSEVIHVSAINKSISRAEAEGLDAHALSVSIRLNRGPGDG